MARKLFTSQTSFVAGELSPLVAGRSGSEVFRNGAEALRNFRALSQGGVRTRPGTRRLAALSAGGRRREAYAFSDSQRYELIFAAGRMDAFLPDGTYAGGLTGAPWTAGMLDRMSIAQGGDTILIFHQDLPPQRIRRIAAASWARDPVPWNPGAFEKFAPVDATLALSADTGTGVTLTVSTDFFEPGHVGVVLRYQGTRILITAVTNATTAVGDIEGGETADDTAATVDWDEYAWSSLRGFPAAGAFAENRLILVGTRSKPTSIHMSRIGQWFDMTLGTEDDDAIWTAIGGERVTQIRHVIAAEKILILTDDGLFYIPTTEQKPLTPANVTLRRLPTEFGASWIRPCIFDGAVLFIDASDRTVREAMWNDTLQTFEVTPLSIAAEHLIIDPVALGSFRGSGEIAEPYAFVVRADGKAAVFHSVRAQRVASWTLWETAGAFLQLGGNGPDIFAIVHRPALGGGQLERLEPSAAPLDCAVVATAGGPTDTFPAAAPHLAGQQAEVVSRGHYLGRVTVGPGGGVVLDAMRPQVDRIEVGLGFTQLVRPMPFDADNPEAVGARKRLIRALLRLDRAGIFRVQGRDVVLRFQGDDVATPAPVFTGFLEILLRGIDRDAQFDIAIEQPAIVTLLGLAREVTADV